MNYYVLGSYAAPFSVPENGQACYQTPTCGALVLAGPGVNPYCQCSR